MKTLQTASAGRPARRPSRCLVTVQEHARDARQAVGAQIIEGMGGPGDVVELFGEEGSAKSRLALGMAEALMGKSSWGPFRVNRNGKVLLLETDMPESSQGALVEEFSRAGYFSNNGLLTLPFGRPSTLYHVIGNQAVVSEWVASSVPDDLVAVIVDTWSSSFRVDGGPQNAYMEGVIRAVVAQLRKDYPSALIVALNHTTGEGSLEGPRSLSPGLRRIATTRYRVAPSDQRDARGRWEGHGALVAEGKFSRSDKLPKKVILRWDWQTRGDPAPQPTLEGLGASEWVALFPDIDGLSGKYESRNDALRDLARVSSISFEALKTAQRRHPNPALNALSAGND
jgi:AAA domain-containing protein